MGRGGGGGGCSLQERMSHEHMLLEHERELFLDIFDEETIFTYFLLTCKINLLTNKKSKYNLIYLW